MENTLNIPKNLNLTKGESFSFLREEGLRLIQEYSGAVWSDHNLHDPGITLLEAFSFVLTELSLKSSIDIKDVIASAKENNQSTLYVPEQILPSQPVTIKDYKKVLIDTNGIRNGWFIPIEAKDSSTVNGLYDVLLEFDDDSTLGEINSGIIERNFDIDYGGGDVRSYVMEVSFPSWDKIPEFHEDVIVDNISSPSSAVIVLESATLDNYNDYFSELEVTYNGLVTPVNISVTMRITPQIGTDGTENIEVANEVIARLSQAVGDDAIINEFNNKVIAAATIEAQVIEKLNTIRNLDEDIRFIKAIRVQEIGIDLRIDILKSINVEKYIAEMIFELENFFKPIIKFSSLTELENEGLSYEEIFNGPLLDHGFLKESVINDLPRATPDDRNSTIYVSDLVNLIMKIVLNNATTPISAIENQIIAISDISISNFIRNIAVAKNAEDCLVLAEPQTFKPRFSLNKSNIQFFRNGLEVAYNNDLVNTILSELRANNEPSVVSNNKSTVPEGDILSISGFHSIQHDFPMTYGLGHNLLPETHPVEKRAKIEQFRGYLTLIDHLLASLSTQLNHVNDLFSIDPTVSNSYFKEALYNIPYYQNILVDFLSSGQTWEAFQSDPTNPYPSSLDSIFESTATFLDRRNRFLDHLLARFGASLDNYISYRYEESSSIIVDSAELESRQMEIESDLILDKINYLSLYPDLSKNRFLAYNHNAAAWDTENISGLARRILTSLGFKNLNRRSFYDELNNYIQITNVGPNFTYEILNKDSNAIIESTTTYPAANLARNAALEIIRLGTERDNFYLESQRVLGGSNLVGIQTDPSDVNPFQAVSTGVLQIDEFEARRTIRQIIRDIKEIGSGVYIVEHILMRPESGAANPTPLEIPESDSLFAEDPYSMRISIIFPSGFERDFDNDTDSIPIIPTQFQSEKFRKVVLGQINEETPAHILASVFWLDINTVADNNTTPSLNNFSEKWRLWIEAKADPLISPLTLQNRRDELIAVLNEIYQLEV